MNGQTWVTLEDGLRVVLLTALRTMRKWRYNNEWWDGSRIVYAKGSAGWETMSVHEAVAKGEGVEFCATHAEMVEADVAKVRERRDPADFRASVEPTPEEKEQLQVRYVACASKLADDIGKGAKLPPLRLTICRTIWALGDELKRYCDRESGLHRRTQKAESEAARWKRRAGVLEADKEQRGRWMRSAAQWLARLREGQHFTVYSAVSALLASRLQKWGPGAECAENIAAVDVQAKGYQRRRWDGQRWVTEWSPDCKTWTQNNAPMHPLLGGARVEMVGGEYVGHVVDFRQMYPGGGYTVRVKRQTGEPFTTMKWPDHGETRVHADGRTARWCAYGSVWCVAFAKHATKDATDFMVRLRPHNLFAALDFPKDLLIGRPIGKATGGIIGQEKKGHTLTDKELLGVVGIGIAVGAAATVWVLAWAKALTWL